MINLVYLDVDQVKSSEETCVTSLSQTEQLFVNGLETGFYRLEVALQL